MLPRSIAWVALLACGCGAAAVPSGPASSVERFADALVRSDAAATWALLDEDGRRGRSEAEHGALMVAHGEELRAVGQSLARAARSDGVSARARVPLASGEVVVLVLGSQGWRIDGGVLDAPGLGTPIDAVAAFRRALLRRDLAGIERTLSRETRAEWEDEVRRLLASTADRDDLEVEVEGERARVRTTGGGRIELVREAGEWRVVDVFGPAAAPP